MYHVRLCLFIQHYRDTPLFSLSHNRPKHNGLKRSGLRPSSLRDSSLKPISLGRFFSQFVAILSLAFVSSCSVETSQTRLDEIIIGVTGDNFTWTFQYPGRDKALGTKDDLYSTQELFLPDNANIVLQLESKDYLYSFTLPEYDLKQIAVPGLSHELQFTTQTARSFRFLGDQFCGFSHDSLKGYVHIINQDQDFYRRIQTQKFQKPNTSV